MPSWRDELIEAVKSKAEREAEEQERHRRRVKEALTTAEAAMNLAAGALRFARDKLVEKSQKAELAESDDKYRLAFRELVLAVELARDAAVIRITYVEEYVGRRAVELVRAAQKADGW